MCHFPWHATYRDVTTPVGVFWLQAYELLGQFLVLKKNKLLFSYWITSTIDIKDEKARECYNCLLDWSDIFL